MGFTGEFFRDFDADRLISLGVEGFEDIACAASYIDDYPLADVTMEELLEAVSFKDVLSKPFPLAAECMGDGVTLFSSCIMGLGSRFPGKILFECGVGRRIFQIYESTAGAFPNDPVSLGVRMGVGVTIGLAAEGAGTL